MSFMKLLVSKKIYYYYVLKVLSWLTWRTFLQTVNLGSSFTSDFFNNMIVALFFIVCQYFAKNKKNLFGVALKILPLFCSTISRTYVRNVETKRDISHTNTKKRTMYMVCTYIQNLNIFLPSFQAKDLFPWCDDVFIGKQASNLPSKLSTWPNSPPVPGWASTTSNARPRYATC